MIADKGLKNSIYEAKEPLTITAVSPEKIVFEDFYNSSFWHKIEHLLLVYYLYDSDKTVEALEYSSFLIKGYEIHEFSKEDIEILQNDWKIIHDFIQMLQVNYSCYENEYPRISHELREKLMYLDTAPKWPNRPRFRLKRSVVTEMVRNYFGEKLEVLPVPVTKFSDFDKRCHDISINYRNKTIEELANIFHIPLGKVNKNIGEQLVVKMFDGKASKFSKIDVFMKIGLIGKSIILKNDGTGTEDIKLFGIDFDDIRKFDLMFEDSTFYQYFSNHIFLFVIFKEPRLSSKNNPVTLDENIFVGFKRITFPENFIQTEVRKTWNEIKYLINNHKLKNIVNFDKSGNEIINKTGVVSSAPNFPKSKTNNVFVRGTGSDSTKKKLEIDGISMYQQYIWLTRTTVINILNKSSYL